MIRNLSIFFGTFIAGALIALLARAAWFDPHDGQAGQPAGGGEYPPMVTNALTPASLPAMASTTGPAPRPATEAPAAGHARHGTAVKTESSQPVNTICAICGMDVDPSLPTASYQGKTIGFGCRMCPPKFKANPERYAPYYLRNEVYKP